MIDSKKQAITPKRIIRLKEVRQRTGLSTSWIYKKMDQDEFPKNFKIFEGGRACGWWQSDIEEFLKSRESSEV